ncbi:MAG TPA: DUF3426 domain-containing protein [Pseudoxanthomonas sp.]|nr:DUF3426 domain-containing protein [Pseudoxanthomonas sp.]
MFHSCPQCRQRIPADPVTHEAPELCLGCGVSLASGQPVAAIPNPAAQPAATPTAAPSLAAFLQRKGNPPAAPTPGDALPAQPPSQAVQNRGGEAEDGTTGPSQDGADELLFIDPPPPAAGVAPAGAEAAMDGQPASAAGVEQALPASAEPTEPSADTEARIGIDPAAPEAHLEAPGIGADAPPGSPEPAAARPAFTRSSGAPAARARAASWQWITVAVLGLGLVLQVLVADRARLAADPAWRPFVSSLCGALGCALPPWRQPEAFTMLSRDVRSMPGTPGALRVQATFRNDARWSQPWPVLLLSLSDADGRVVGARSLSADDYLDPSTTQAGLAPGQSAQIVLQLREPDAAVVAFSFDFR